MGRLIIVGAGGHAAVIAEAAQLVGTWNEINFVDDKYPDLTTIIGLKVVGTSSCLRDLINSETYFIVAIGNNQTRFELYQKMQDAGGQMVSVIHPSAVVSASAIVRPGTAVMAQAVINARTSIDVACIINTGATVDHDCYIGPAAHVSPGAHVGGGVTVGKQAWVGIGACVKNNLRIGGNAVVGAAAGVVNDVPAESTVIGVPAREVVTR